jgi:transcriptional regulator with XRE-family HTH domain
MGGERRDGHVSSPLGEIIRHQRELQALSMRQFARMVGISNPYLSQIERGLRDPSEQVLQGIADSLQTSVDVLYEQAGVPHDEDGAEPSVIAAVRADPDLTARQRSALIEVYEAFTGRSSPRRRRSSSARTRGGASEASASEAPGDS